MKGIIISVFYNDGEVELNERPISIVNTGWLSDGIYYERSYCFRDVINQKDRFKIGEIVNIVDERPVKADGQIFDGSDCEAGDIVRSYVQHAYKKISNCSNQAEINCEKSELIGLHEAIRSSKVDKVFKKR